MTAKRLGRSVVGCVGCVACLFVLFATGCFADTVAPGYYGSPDDAGLAMAVAPSGDSPGTASTSGSSTTPETDAGSVVASASDSGLATKTVGCDLSGRWIATEHRVATALGAQEASHTWLYYETTQSGSSGTITKGLDCGQNVRGISSVSADVDYQKTWPAMLTKDLETGRTFTSTASSGGCSVSFEKRYTVTGATVAFYGDPSQTMPMASQQASSTAPGWEDWDNDGHPGFTMNVTGLATGQIYIAIRVWNMFSGTIATGASTFKLADSWNSEQDLLGYTGSSLLTETASGTRDNNNALHFVQFARLGATQATGDDTTVCASIRTLAPTLTPDASAN
jgi:hypothetical protein